MDDESYEQTMQELYDRSISYAPHESPEELERPLAGGDVAGGGGGATHVDADADVDPQQQHLQPARKQNDLSRNHPGSSVFSSVVMKHKAARRRSSLGSLESQGSSSNSLTTGIAITSSPVMTGVGGGGGAFSRGKKKAALAAARDHAHSLPIVSHDGWYDFGVQKGGGESPRGRIKRRLFFGLVAVLLVALAAAIVAVGVKSTANDDAHPLSGSEGEKGGNNVTGGGVGGDDGIDVAHDDEVVDVAALCSPSVIDSVIGSRAECARHCQQARCCFVDDPSNAHQVDCTDDADFCDEFAPCKIIFSEDDTINDDVVPNDGVVDDYSDGKDLPHPPSNLHDICSSMSVSTTNGLAQCEMACLEAECCLPSVDEVDSCFSGNEGTCDDYARYCYTVTGELAGPPPRAEVELVPPPDHLDVMCNVRDGSSSDVECEDACTKAECCWTIEPERSCYFQNAGLCKVYFRSCHVVMPDYLVDEDDDGDNQDGDGGSLPPPPPPPEDLDVICSAKDGRSRCGEVCRAAKCCWLREDRPDLYCYHDFRHLCEQYHHSCKAIFSHHGDAADDDDDGGDEIGLRPPPPPGDFDVLCSSEDSKAQCGEACRQAECCWPMEDRPHLYCYHESTDVCQLYHRSCKTIFSNHQDQVVYDDDDEDNGGDLVPSPPPPPDDLGVMCTSPDEGARCEEACHEAECCWLNKDKPDAYCYHEYREVCTRYHSSCKRFFAHHHNNVGEGGSGSLGTVNNGMGEVPAFITAPANLSQVCVHDSTAELREECERLCEPAMCCLADPVDCTRHGVDVACDEFEDPCSVLDLGASLARACIGAKNSEMEADLELCRELCEPGRCCYEQEGSECSTSGLDVLCESYDPFCSAVFVDPEFLVVVGGGDSGGDVPPPEFGPELEEEIRHACKDLLSTRSGWEACEELCEPYICCFDKTAPSCDPNAEYRCGKWVLPCETLFQKHAGSGMGSGEAEGSEGNLEEAEEHEKERPIRDDSLQYEVVKNDEYEVATTEEHEEERSPMDERPEDFVSVTDTVGGTLLADGHCPVCDDEASCIHSYEPVLCGPNKECLYGNECEAICAGFVDDVDGRFLSPQCVSFRR